MPLLPGGRPAWEPGIVTGERRRPEASNSTVIRTSSIGQQIVGAALSGRPKRGLLLGLETERHAGRSAALLGITPIISRASTPPRPSTRAAPWSHRKHARPPDAKVRWSVSSIAADLGRSSRQHRAAPEGSSTLAQRRCLEKRASRTASTRACSGRPAELIGGEARDRVETLPISEAAVSCVSQKTPAFAGGCRSNPRGVTAL
jgi:hypothetical protein